MSEIFHDPQNWVLFSFLLFAVVAFKFGKAPLLSALDQRIETIRKEVEAAAHLKTEAHALLMDFEHRQRDAQAEADAIVENARQQAAAARLREEAKLVETLARKEQQMEDHLRRLRDQALSDIRQVAAELALTATRDVVQQKLLDEESRTRLLARSLGHIAQKLQ